MRAFIVLPVAVALLFSTAACQSAGETSARVGEGGWKSVEIEDFTVAWLEMEDSYRFTVTAPTSGWVAIGFGGGPAMKDAAIVIGYSLDGEGFIRDDHGTSPVAHAPDTELGGSSDISEYGVREVDGSTEMTFVIPADPEDQLDPALAPETTLRVLVAHGEQDDFTGMHSAAHSAEITL